ncbi:MAG: response regulator transcription factor [Dehalococcoidia bacterium]
MGCRPWPTSWGSARSAGGKSNQDITEEPFISPHTVIRHVSNIFSKTDASNRTEAAVAATRHGTPS